MCGVRELAPALTRRRRGLPSVAAATTIRSWPSCPAPIRKPDLSGGRSWGVSGRKTSVVSAREKLDWLLIFAAMACLWPWAFGFRPPWYRLVLLASLTVMALMAARRLRLMRRTGQ